MKEVCRYILLLVIVVVSIHANSQTNGYYLVSSDYLPEKYKAQIDKAEKLVNRGEEILEKVEMAQQKVQEYESSDPVKPIKLMALKEDVFRFQLKASSFFHDAHRREFKALKRFLKDQYPLQYERVHDEVVKQFYRGSVLRKRGVEAVPSNSPMGFIQEALAYEMLALKDLEMIYVFDKKPLRARAAPAFENDSVLPISHNLKELQEKYAKLKPHPGQTVEKSIVSKERLPVFFSIQFLATRKPVSEQRARTVYNGSLELIRSYGSGWHRFSAGRFDSVQKATRVMKQEGIYGFVVAIRGEERISIKKAQQLLSP